MVSFEAEILIHGDSATHFVVPPEAIAALEERRRPPVEVRIGDVTYRSTVAPMGGQHLIPLNRANRESCGVTAGDVVTVTLSLYAAPRVVEVPDDLGEALGGDAEIATTFADLSYSHQKEYVDWIVEAKRPETRARRISRTIEMLRDDSRQAAESR